MKQFLIKLLIDYILDAIGEALNQLSRQSDNTIDDQAVKVYLDNREQIKALVKSNVTSTNNS